ncbi:MULTISPECIES: hypothetical protein [unclassified Fusobacterium]|uniref:hypothetical protein n=1 Tax=unclassified Fusobacterium TaxID=2648384 RepID=UPI001B8CBF89|nr:MULTISPECIES: hypothetical protein [unclassified Fusobacterium]MBR8702076.1 hypothetical protein [Fusobacterium sp. DD45]MBR8711869.1 hypothetical protein [Fusobacterium sp. DD28]MBR8752451.1 hypothetical protein [Fusobacterium sp. DD26]
MDARNDNARNINYKCIIRHSDGSEEELSENLTYEELMDFLKNYEGENGTINIKTSTSGYSQEDIQRDEESLAESDEHNDEKPLPDYKSSLEDDSESSEDDLDLKDDMEDEVDEDYDEEPEEELSANSLVTYSDWDDDERCPMCGSTDIDDLERGTLVGSITGGVLGFSRRRVVKSFLPDFASRGVGGVIGYAVGYAAGKVLDKKVLNNRKCAHCGYEWHEDEDIF